VLFAYADRIRPLGWALQILCALEQLKLIAPIIPTLQIPVIVDRLGSLHPARGPGRSQAAYQTFIELLKIGKVWTKLSRGFRFPDVPDLDDYVFEILNVA
jgi:predicted TIM-barrel fold metal-dependent hydrolase